MSGSVNGEPLVGGVFDGAVTASTVVRVRDVASSVAWYREKLGWEPIYVGSDGPEHPIAAFAIAGSIVSLWQLPGGTQRVQEDNDRNTYVVVVVDGDLASLRGVLAARGVRVGSVRRSANAEFFWFYDLDDNRFELSRPLTEEFETAARTAADS